MRLGSSPIKVLSSVRSGAFLTVCDWKSLCRESASAGASPGPPQVQVQNGLNQQYMAVPPGPQFQQSVDTSLQNSLAQPYMADFPAPQFQQSENTHFQNSLPEQYMAVSPVPQFQQSVDNPFHQFQFQFQDEEPPQVIELWKLKTSCPKL